MTDPVRVLVIDDNEDDRASYRRALTRIAQTPYEIVEAADGELGAALLDAERVQCVLLDYSLPGRNGVEVLKRLRAKHAFIPVIILTGQGNETVAVSAMQGGAQDYIVKSGITGETLDRAIQLAIARCAMERRIEDQRLSLEIFTRALAHDLKEPVRTIKSFISVLMGREQLSPDASRYFGYVHDAADRMAALIDAVYLYTRLDSSALPLAKETVDLNVLLKEAEVDLSELIAERHATITAGPLPAVEANTAQLRQVLQNLISNAIRHCPHDAAIHVDALDAPDDWIIRVADNGPGVDTSQREKIFEPFIRLSHQKSQGLGMGLAICKRIVETHGGRIWCDNRPEGGAMFQFKLPKQPGDARTQVARPTPKAAVPAPAPADNALARVLVVDDNEAAIELTRILLVESAKLRCQLVSASSGEEALALLSPSGGEGAIDLVLLDINMPRMDGFELLRRMREDELMRNVPVVMCSTSSYDKDMERARVLGAAGFVTKPATLKNLKPFLEQVSGLRLAQVNGHSALLRVA